MARSASALRTLAVSGCSGPSICSRSESAWARSGSAWAYSPRLCRKNPATWSKRAASGKVNVYCCIHWAQTNACGRQYSQRSQAANSTSGNARFTARTLRSAHCRCALVQALLEDYLHQTMEIEQFSPGVALDQRIAPQHLDGSIEEQGISSYRRKHWPQVYCSLGKDRFGDSIRVQEGAQAQQISRRRVGLLHLLKGELPGAGNRARIVGRQAALLLEKRQVVPMIEFKILR